MEDSFGPSLELGQEFLIGGTLGEVFRLTTERVEDQLFLVMESDALKAGVAEFSADTLRLQRDILDIVIATFDAEALREGGDTPASLLD